MRLRRHPPPDDSTEFRLDKARTRMEILEAIDRAMGRRAEVMGLVAAAPDVDAARNDVMQLLHIGPLAATAVFDIQIRRWAVEERQKISDEVAELSAYIRELGG